MGYHARITEESKGEKMSVSQEAILKVCSHKYTGNFRELEHILIKAMMRTRYRGEREIQPDDIIFEAVDDNSSLEQLKPDVPDVSKILLTDILRVC